MLSGSLINSKEPSYIIVKDQDQLKQTVSHLERQTAIGVDLEADSLFHYYQKVCLIQISTPVQNFLLDPLAIGELTALKGLFADSGIRKIFHGADYDIRSLNRDFDIEVNSLFDTQIAAAFLGIKETGLANLLKDRFNIIMEKKYQKKDWSKRPLPKPMLEYAIHDSLYLLPLAGMLESELRKKGRFVCVEEECERLSKVRVVESNGEPLFLKFKGAGRLDQRSLTLLEAVLQFRDKKARHLDRPSFKVFGTSQIKSIVREKPRNLKELEGKKCLTARQISEFGRALLRKINNALDLSEDDLLEYPARKTGNRIGPRVAKRVKILKQWRQQRAEQLGIDPALICPNSQVQLLAALFPKDRENLSDISEMRNWQKDFFGDEICALLNS